MLANCTSTRAVTQLSASKTKIKKKHFVCQKVKLFRAIEHPGVGGKFDPSVDIYAMKSHERAPKKEVCFMAIIYILTPYDAEKKAAHVAKTVKHGAGAEISTVNPEQYSKRFSEFTSNILMWPSLPSARARRLDKGQGSRERKGVFGLQRVKYRIHFSTLPSRKNIAG
ncbi:hypothetical protein ACRRTK_003431 [Alexandromys fortis]